MNPRPVPALAAILAASLPLLLAMPVHSQIPGPNDPPQTRPSEPSTRRPSAPASRPPSGDQFEMADKNKDGKVSRQEYMQNVRDRFAAADRNKDGFISRQEFEGQFPPQTGGDQARRQQMLDQSFSILDVDKDGKISRKEQEAVAADLFKALDTNNDNAVTRDEAAALRNARRPTN